MMNRQVAHLVHLVDDLLDVARINAGKIDLHFQALTMREVVARSVEASQSSIDRHGHSLILHQEEELFVNGDRDRLTQVFSNLLSNAAKYTERGGRIEVRVQREGKEAVISVADNGIGIPADAIAGVFKVFCKCTSIKAAPMGVLGSGCHSYAISSKCTEAPSQPPATGLIMAALLRFACH